MTNTRDMEQSSTIEENQGGRAEAERSEARRSTFTIFTELPTEIRLQVWSLSLTSRIVKWARVNEKNVFSAPSKLLPLLSVSKESREACLLYGAYRKLPTSPDGCIWFSPLVDYLFFDPGWIDLVGPGHMIIPRVDPLDSLLPELGTIRNIMVHPNYTDDRKKPTALFEKLPMLERILVAADEKSIGFQSKFMIGTVYDIKLYYVAMAKKRRPDIRVPYIAISCLGWTGDERRNMHHGGEDTRQLVAVCENHSQIMTHLKSVRDEEWKFVQENFQRNRPRLTLNMRRPHNLESISTTLTDPPSYSDATLVPERTRSDVSAPAMHQDSPKSRWHRCKSWCRKLLSR